MLTLVLLGVLVDPLASVGAAQTRPGTVVPPKPEGCEVGCKCNGTGLELSGDGILKINCRCDDDCGCKPPKTPPPPPPKTSRKLYRMPGPRWTWGVPGTPTLEQMKAHLRDVHGIDATGWSREVMQAGHDNIHNGHSFWGREPSSAGGFQSSCPSGRCPLR